MDTFESNFGAFDVTRRVVETLSNNFDRVCFVSEL